MKSLLIISATGRSGSTTLTCLLARHLQCACHRRVLVLDQADPPRCAHLLAGYGYDAIASGKRVPAPKKCTRSASDGCVHVLNADATDGLLLRDDPDRTRYYANLRHRLTAVARWFDVCLIDAPALPDLRTVCAEALVDAVLSPVAVTPAAMEEAWMKVMETTLREWLIADAVSPRGYVWLPHLSSVRHMGSFAPGQSERATRDAEVPEGLPENVRAQAACLAVLTHQLAAIGNGTARALRHVEVCDA